LATTSNIEWTDTTWQPIRGCQRISPGCQNCYAERQSIRLAGPGKAYEGLVQLTKGGPRWTGKYRHQRDELTKPLRWRKARKVFVCSMGDLFFEKVPDEIIDDVFAVMLIACLQERGPEHIFQVLTKRAQRLSEYTNDSTLPGRLAESAGQLMEDGDAWHDIVYDYVEKHGPVHERIWAGVSCESADYTHRLDSLCEARGAVKWVSLEPLLGRVDVRGWLDDLDWVVVGGESGSGNSVRGCSIDWIRNIICACQERGVAVFCKQLGSRPFQADTSFVSKPYPIDTFKGGDPAEWPAALRVREYPR